jgi:NAD(P)-dependent dehydrogenase (short-subunit alcohol dehydrogenase family)
MEKHMRSNAGAAILISQALHAHIAQRNSKLAAEEPLLTGAVVNLLDQKLWNQAPDFVSYALSKAALNAANSMLAMALAPLVRVVGVDSTLDTSAAVLQALQGAEAVHV